MLNRNIAVKQYFLYDVQSVLRLFDVLSVRLGRLCVRVVRFEVRLKDQHLAGEVVSQVFKGQCSVTVSNWSWAL